MRYRPSVALCPIPAGLPWKSLTVSRAPLTGLPSGPITRPASSALLLSIAGAGGLMARCRGPSRLHSLVGSVRLNAATGGSGWRRSSGNDDGGAGEDGGAGDDGRAVDSKAHDGGSVAHDGGSGPHGCGSGTGGSGGRVMVG